MKGGCVIKENRGLRKYNFGSKVEEFMKLGGDINGLGAIRLGKYRI